ncbi:hypothetical protein ARMGADRAFT_1142775 [Armillaria gallica]|uniref:Uncharacterized protein n=1 Tax=Armillaria gallica TaxID=47427 RepID=A0A2H3E8U6_ARMGA|nr:hypothetical protein ARMGADRAFT_1142775 [Armillaria gallica]
MLQAPPSDISQDDKNGIFVTLDVNLNSMVLQALLHGLYTGIVAVTLWTIFSSPKRFRGTLLFTMITVLYMLLTTLFAMAWTMLHHAFIENGDSYYTVIAALGDQGSWWRAYSLYSGISGVNSMGRKLKGSDMAMLDLVGSSMANGTNTNGLYRDQYRISVMKGIQIFTTSRNPGINHFTTEINWSLVYILLTLSTTVMCTVTIVYRLLRYTPGISASRKLVEMLIESSSIYSLSLIIYLATVSKNLESSFYADIIAAYCKAIAPTLLVGRVSAHNNAISRRHKMIAMWENHTPLVGCFREEDFNDSPVYHCPDDGHQTPSGSSGKETV